MAKIRVLGVLSVSRDREIQLAVSIEGPVLFPSAAGVVPVPYLTDNFWELSQLQKIQESDLEIHFRGSNVFSLWLGLMREPWLEVNRPAVKTWRRNMLLGFYHEPNLMLETLHKHPFLIQRMGSFNYPEINHNLKENLKIAGKFKEIRLSKFEERGLTLRLFKPAVKLDFEIDE